MLRKLLRFLTGRLFISLVLIVVQLATLFLVLFYVQNNAVWFQILSGLSIVMTLVVVVRDLNPAYKIGWMLLFMFFPSTGIFYILFGNRRLNRRLRDRLEQLNVVYQKGSRAAPTATCCRCGRSRATPIPSRGKRSTSSTSPATRCGRTPRWSTSSGEAWVIDLLEELAKAKSFIFLEFFIVAEGEVWDAVLAVLLDRIRRGVRVCLMFDDAGSLFTLIRTRYPPPGPGIEVVRSTRCGPSQQPPQQPQSPQGGGHRRQHRLHRWCTRR